ncbi:MAG: endonuclease [Prevotella sp.]|nr:endonuclease [Prevotella sp.]
MKRTLLITLLMMAMTAVAWAQGPNSSGTYYQGANGLKGKALKTKLASIIVNPRNVGYDGLYEAYKKTDTRPDGYVRDWYSNTTNYRHGVDNKGSYSKEGDMYNREHSVPQSWFSGSGIKSDIMHVLPTDGYVNNRRSNYPFGEVNNVTYQSNNGYSKLGSCKTAGYNGTVFEPNDEIKGDIARIYFYMITRYESSCGSWGHDVFTTTYPGLTTWTLDMMMRWSKNDPVDEREIQRNNAVYEVQGNRNPYVDYPGLEEYTWGTKMTEAFSYDNYGGEVNPDAVMPPTFSPAAGTYTNSVTVTLSTTTEDANIYYTTDGTDATLSSTLYTGSFTLTETTTVKAIAVQEDRTSTQSVATFTITTGGTETPVDGVIGLNNTLFGTSFDGAIPSSHSETLQGTQNGVTVIYDISEGSNRYCNGEQIRLYPGNRLTFSVAEGTITGLEFTSPEPKSGLTASTGTMTGDLTWTGNAQTVVFTYESTKHIKLSSVKVTLQGSTSIDALPTTSSAQPTVIYDLQGRRVDHPTKGIYIINGKKVVVK